MAATTANAKPRLSFESGALVWVFERAFCFPPLKWGATRRFAATVHLRGNRRRELFAQANSCRLVGELTPISMGAIECLTLRLPHQTPRFVFGKCRRVPIGEANRRLAVKTEVQMVAVRRLAIVKQHGLRDFVNLR